MNVVYCSWRNGSARWTSNSNLLVQRLWVEGELFEFFPQILEFPLNLQETMNCVLTFKKSDITFKEDL